MPRVQHALWYSVSSAIDADRLWHHSFVNSRSHRCEISRNEITRVWYRVVGYRTRKCQTSRSNSDSTSVIASLAASKITRNVVNISESRGASTDASDKTAR